MPKDLKISIIGAGNVAWHLAPALAATADVRIIVSRHAESAEALAERVGKGCRGVCGVANLNEDSDLYLIATNDDAIAEIAASTPDFPGIWAHTSGSVDIDVFRGWKARYGSFYPLQTFSRGNSVNVREVPFFIEGNTPATEQQLTSLAGQISTKVFQASSQRRRALHIAAVFACNFANQMWNEADKLLHEQGLDISCMLPLIKATLDKLPGMTPREAMTGPARRGDIDVIQSHLNELPEDAAEVYRVVTRRILNEAHPNITV